MLFALGLFGALLFALGFPAHAQQLVKAPKLGCYMLGAAGLGTREEAFRQGLKDLGYVEGQNIFIEWRFAAGQADQDKTIVDELVRLNVDIIVTDGNRSTSAAKNATRTIPIVMAVSGDPLGAGLVKTLARPGGNITGLTLLSPELSGKRLEILKETMPKISHVAVLFNPSNPGATLYLNEVQVAAKSLGLQLQTLKASSPTELASALDLGRPLRFWHMLIESNTYRPMFKYWSPMSVGSWALLVFGIFVFLAFLEALVEDDRLAWPAGRKFRPPGMLGGVIAVIGGLFGFYVAGYTGVLLAVTNRPIWSDTPLLGMLFVVSAASISYFVPMYHYQLSGAVTGRAHALITLPDAMLFSSRVQVAKFAAQNRVPAMFPESEFVNEGGLMSYGPNLPDLFRRAAVYVDKILKGAKPADLPVEQPTKFELIINLKTAKQIGLTIPPTVLARADRVIR